MLILMLSRDHFCPDIKCFIDVFSNRYFDLLYPKCACTILLILRIKLYTFYIICIVSSLSHSHVQIRVYHAPHPSPISLKHILVLYRPSCSNNCNGIYHLMIQFRLVCLFSYCCCYYCFPGFSVCGSVRV
jgi:hypothetical protein